MSNVADRLPKTVLIGESVLYQELEDEVVLLNMADQQYYGLNDVAAHMWKCLMEEGDVATAGDSLSQKFDIEQSVVRADLEGLVLELLAAGLLKAV